MDIVLGSTPGFTSVLLISATSLGIKTLFC